MNSPSCTSTSQDKTNPILEELRELMAENVKLKETHRKLKQRFYEESKLEGDEEKRLKKILKLYAKAAARQNVLTEEVNEIQETLQNYSEMIENLFIPKKVEKRNPSAKNSLFNKKEALIEEQNDLKEKLIDTQKEVEDKRGELLKISASVEKLKLDISEDQVQYNTLRQENEILEAKLAEIEANYAKKKDLEESQACSAKDSASRKFDEEITVTDYSVTNKNTSFGTPMSVVRKAEFGQERSLGIPHEPLQTHKFFNFETMSVVSLSSTTTAKKHM